MKLTYRARKRLRTLFTAGTALIVVGTLVWLCWLIWLGRFIVYSDGAARLDFDWVPSQNAVEALPQERETVAIHYNEGDDAINNSSELTQINGSYVTLADWLAGVDAVEKALQDLPSGSVVMLDLKSIYGNFYYSSKEADGNITDQVDVAAIDDLITQLTRSDYYVIARVTALRDRAYGLTHTNFGLAHSSGRYLWYDEQNCYWLDPTSAGTLNHLTDIAEELKRLGFDEVVFTEFRFPDTTNIIFSGNRSEALASAAQTLVDNCATDSFAVSFETSDTSLRIPEGRSRLFLTGVEASRIPNALNAVTVTDPLINLVFVTESNDTRFDPYSIMRPILIVN